MSLEVSVAVGKAIVGGLGKVWMRWRSGRGVGDSVEWWADGQRVGAMCEGVRGREGSWNVYAVAILGNIMCGASWISGRCVGYMLRRARRR